jgi:hypothetical protein
MIDEHSDGGREGKGIIYEAMSWAVWLRVSIWERRYA